MSSMRMRVRPSRLAAVVVIALAALPLSGCLFGSIPSDPPTTEAPPSTAAPTPEESGESEGTAPANLSFDDGDLLSDSVYIEWGDGLMVDDGWKVVSPDDGNGGWKYGTTDGTCTAQFWQGYTSDIEVTPGDDSASSDAILGAILQTDLQRVAEVADDGGFAYQSGGNTDVANRQVVGQDGDRTWIMAARAFATPGLGVYLIIDCAGGDANAVFTEVVKKNAIVVH